MNFKPTGSFTGIRFSSFPTLAVATPISRLWLAVDFVAQERKKHSVQCEENRDANMEHPWVIHPENPHRAKNRWQERQVDKRCHDLYC
jgi:hypothetical protein